MAAVEAAVALKLRRNLAEGGLFTLNCDMGHKWATCGRRSHTRVRFSTDASVCDRDLVHVFRTHVEQGLLVLDDETASVFFSFIVPKFD